jgi:hypothetical protein
LACLEYAARVTQTKKSQKIAQWKF